MGYLEGSGHGARHSQALAAEPFTVGGFPFQRLLPILVTRFKITLEYALLPFLHTPTLFSLDFSEQFYASWHTYTRLFMYKNV